MTEDEHIRTPRPEGPPVGRDQLVQQALAAAAQADDPTAVGSSAAGLVHSILGATEEAAREIREETESVVQGEAAHIIAQAEREAERIRDRARRDAEAVLGQARAQAAAEAGDRSGHLSEYSETLLQRAQVVLEALDEAELVRARIRALARELRDAADAHHSTAPIVATEPPPIGALPLSLPPEQRSTEAPSQPEAPQRFDPYPGTESDSVNR